MINLLGSTPHFMIWFYFVEIFLLAIISALVFLKLDTISRKIRITLFFVSIIVFTGLNSWHFFSSQHDKEKSNQKTDSLISVVGKASYTTDTIFIVSNQIHDAVKELSNKPTPTTSYYGGFQYRKIDRRIFESILWFMNEYAIDDKPGIKRKVYSANPSKSTTWSFRAK